MAVVVEKDGRIVAIGGAETPEWRRYAHRAEFGLTVVKRCWGMGIGRALTEFAVAWARQAGLRKLDLRVFADNTRAIALYRSLGFVEEARLKNDYQRADGTFGDTLLMAVFFEA